MSALPSLQFDLPDQQMRSLRTAGYSLIPLGGGGDGKSPLCSFSQKDISLGQCLGIMRANGSLAYGVRLADLVVVDVDEFSPETEQYVVDRFGPSPVQVATPRGRHFYYKHSVGALPNLRAEGLSIDIKSGANAYVAGPGSVRPDGGEYVAIVGDLASAKLLTFHDNLAVSMPSAAAFTPEGLRNQFLCKQAREYAPCVDTLDELVANLLHDRDTQCETGANPMPDAEIVKIAEWGWNLRTKPGGLFKGRQSRFDVERRAMDVLLAIPNGGAEAFALYGLLTSEHRHTPGKRFGLDFEAMRNAGRVSFGRNRFRAAIGILEQNGLLRKVGRYSPGRFSQQYQLGRLNDGPLVPEEIGAAS